MDQADAELRARPGDLTPDERLEALREFGAEHGRHAERTHDLRQRSRRGR